MALTKEGFKRETYEEIFARTETKAKEQFGEDANTSARSALGILLRVWSWLISLVWQEIENVYYSAYRKTAHGKQLDALMPYSGISRNPATHATGAVVFTGTAGTNVEMGTKITKVDEIVYLTLEDVVIAQDGTARVEIMAEEAGVSGNAEIGTISEILNPMDGLNSVTNIEAITNGSEVESDAELRDRADLAVEGQGSGTTASIRTALLKVESVRAAYVDENYNDATNSYGTPPASIQAFVLGGTDEEVVQAIHSKRSAGIRPYGASSAVVIDASGTEKIYGFTRAEVVDIFAKVTLTTNASYENDGEAQVKKVIAEYVGGTDTASYMYNGLNMGDDVILSKLMAMIYRVNGIDDVDVTLSIDGITYSRNNVEVALQQVARITASNIEVV